MTLAEGIKDRYVFWTIVVTILRSTCWIYAYHVLSVGSLSPLSGCRWRNASCLTRTSTLGYQRCTAAPRFKTQHEFGMRGWVGGIVQSGGGGGGVRDACW